MTTSGESLNLEVMSPAAVAYLLEVISADINKVDEINRLRKNSGNKPEADISSENRTSSSDESSSSATASSPGSSVTSPPPDTTVALPPVSTVFSYDFSALCAAQTSMTSTLVDVTNSQHQQQRDTMCTELKANKEKQSLQSKRPSTSRKHMIEVDDVSDDDGNREDEVTSRKTRKRNRSSTSEGNCLSRRRKLSSTRSFTKPKSPGLEPSTTAVVPSTHKAPSKAASDDVAKTTDKPSRSRRFKEDELAFLDAVYKTEPYPDPMITERLSIQLDVPEHRIKVWFANRRHRQSRAQDNKAAAVVQHTTVNQTVTVAQPAAVTQSVKVMQPAVVTQPVTGPVTVAQPVKVTQPITQPVSQHVTIAQPVSQHVTIAQPVTVGKKDHQLVTETAALPAESSNASSAFPSVPSLTPQYGMVPSNSPFTPPYGMVPSGYEYTHQPSTPSPVQVQPPPHTPDFAAESRRRSQIATTIQSRFPYSSPALIQLANQTMLSRSGLNPYHHHPMNYPVGMSSYPPDGFKLPPGADICDLARMPRRRPSSYNSYYWEPPILPPLTLESTSYTDGVSLSPAIDDSPSPWHWMP
ncbi:uncharacterized protein [Amphiura filiformis]|uniref:uncharacterized protein n=1 Tax=Amphiura filiformis TaxID=82378 RepID=UPI003B220BF0